MKYDTLDGFSPVVFAVDDMSLMGGVQHVIYELADVLADRGARPGVISLFESQRTRVQRGRHPIGEFVVHGRPLNLLYSPVTPWTRAKLLARGKRAEVRAFDSGVSRLGRLVRNTSVIVVAMQLRIAEYLVAAGLSADRLIVQYHDCFGAAQRWDLARLRHLAPHVGRLLCLTGEDAERFRSAGLPHMGYQPNPVDVARLATEAPERRENVVVAAGRFEDQKAYEVLVDAWSRVSPDHPDWRLELYGSGSREESLCRQAAALRSISILAPTDRLQERLRTAAIHAMSSRHEGMPIVIAEAMCARTPTVATDCSAGVRELVRPGITGELAPIGDPAALARALARLISDPAKRDRQGENALAHIRRYDTPRIITQWHDHLARLPRAREDDPDGF